MNVLYKCVLYLAFLLAFLQQIFNANFFLCVWQIEMWDYVEEKKLLFTL